MVGFGWCPNLFSRRIVSWVMTDGIEWTRVMVTCVAIWFVDVEDIFLLAGDETEVSKNKNRRDIELPAHLMQMQQ